MENEKKQSEGIGIAGFILAFFFPLMGLILSIVGVVKGKKNNNGIGFAVAGIIISALWLILRFLLIILLVFVFRTINIPGLINDSYTEMCSKAEKCEYEGANFYNCSYKEGNVTYTISCTKDRVPEKLLNPSKYSLEEIEEKVSSYYMKYYDGLLDHSRAVRIGNKQVEVKLYSKEEETYENIIGIYTLDEDTLKGTDSHGEVIDILNPKFENID